jgi:translation initiation factor IF-2
LLSTINLISEINEYKSNPNRMANGIVLESNLDKGLGPVATLIITAGTLKKSDIILAGSTYGKVRLMQNHNKQVVDAALPGDPVVVSGFIEVPVAGDKFLVMSDENSAKQLAQSRNQKMKREGQTSISSEIKQQIEDGTLKNINLIIKSDVHGSLEAIKQLISKIEVNGATVTIIRAAIGTVTESDLLLAQTASAMIYTFNIRTQTTVQDMAKEKGIDIRFHNIIYKLKEELEGLLKGKLDPIIEEKVMGQAEVQEL